MTRASRPAPKATRLEPGAAARQSIQRPGASASVSIASGRDQTTSPSSPPLITPGCVGWLIAARIAPS